MHLQLNCAGISMTSRDDVHVKLDGEDNLSLLPHSDDNSLPEFEGKLRLCSSDMSHLQLLLQFSQIRQNDMARKGILVA